MSMELDTQSAPESCEERVKRLNSEPKLAKSKPELGSRSKEKPQIPDGDLVESDFAWYEDRKAPYIYRRGDFVYKNKTMKKIEAEIEAFSKRSRDLGLGPYDAIAHPQIAHSFLCGGIIPLYITDAYRVTLTNFCHLALKDYNQKVNDKSFVFHDLEKCTKAVGTSNGNMYYITFQAKAKEDPNSNTPAAITTTFHTKVWAGRNKEPEIKECLIKI